MIDATILADSLSPANIRLTTMQVTYPRIIHAEVLTHRVFARNSASSRAIPTRKLLEQVMERPFVPGEWGRDQAGMQAGEVLGEQAAADARSAWLHARDQAVLASQELHKLGVHKQLANRPLEPFLWHTVIITATEWDNFFHLRLHSSAQPEIQATARAMKRAMDNSTPRRLNGGQIHLPLVTDEELETMTPEYWANVSIGRCARVSYLTHDGKRDPEKDVELCERLIASGHMSPTEHVAIPMEYSPRYSGNLFGWHQFRKMIPDESDPLGRRQA